MEIGVPYGPCSPGTDGGPIPWDARGRTPPVSGPVSRFMQPDKAPSISATAPYRFAPNRFVPSNVAPNRVMARSPCSAFSCDRLTIYSARLRQELSSNPEHPLMSKKLVFLLPL